MSFFGNIDTTTSSFELGGGDLAPIPENTKVLAIAEEAKNDEYQGTRSIKVKWRISQPAAYANRVIFQKLQVCTPDKADKHKRMLAAIATNAGGQLFQAMQQTGETEPSDMSLSTITNRPMVLQLGIWESEDKSKSGNWVKAVSARKSPAGAPPAPVPVAPPPPKPAPCADIDDSDIPF